MGREKELSCLNTLFEYGRLRRENHIVYIHGHAGQGKSRLAWEFYEKTKNVNKIFLAGYRETHFGLYALRQLVDSYFKIDDKLTNAEALANYEQILSKLNWPKQEDEELKPALASFLDIQYPESEFERGTPLERENLQKEAFVGFLTALINDSELLIFFDDIQWLDKDFADYMRSIHIKQTHASFIIATSRYLDQGHTYDLFLEDFIKHEIHLEQLNEKDSALLLEDIIDKEIKEQPILQEIIQKSQGNPLFLEQLGYSYLEHSFAYEDGKSQLNQAIFNISDVINSRIDCLGKSLQKCLYCAAILGNNFSTNLLAFMMERRLDEELKRGVQMRLWKKYREGIYSFGHILIRDVVYERMLSSQAKELHKIAAGAISSYYGGDLGAHIDEIAYHHEKSCNLPQAEADYYKAALYHRRKNNWRKALLYQRKSTLLAGKYFGFGSSRHISRLFWLGIIYHSAQLYDKAEAIYNITFRANTGLTGGDEIKLSGDINNLGRLYKDMQRFDEGEILLRRSLRIEAMVAPRSANVADRLNNLSSLFLKRGDFKKALAYAKLAYKYFTSWPHVNYVEYHALMRHNLGSIHIKLGNIELAEEMIRLAMSDFRRVHHKNHPRYLSCVSRLGDIFFIKKDFEAALKSYKEAYQGYVFYFNKDFPACKIQEKNIAKVHAAVAAL
ncbi:MAG TPA: tetratricopeptide repeat protein [Candidatus Cloacimonetes bacterium]|nr:tetratricopeptide repeat protein [Candidatus Cloacimonadota bacterium]